MSRLDEELRRAARGLAEEPLPNDILDDSLGPTRSRRSLASPIAGVVGVVLVAVAVGLAIDRLPVGPSPSGTPEPSAEASPVGACEDLLTPSGGADIVLVRFPCGPAGTLVSGVRSIAPDIAPAARLHIAIGAVLDGPTELERSAGFGPVVPAGSASLLDGVKLSDDGLATIGFTDELLRISNLSASAAGGAFLEALRETAFQFDEVTAIEFTASGSCEAFFEFFQSGCDHIARPVDGVLGDCAAIPPAELPSGAPPSAPRPYPGQAIVSWGTGEDTVQQWIRTDPIPMPEGASPVEVRGYEGWVAPSGDDPLPAPFDIAWSEAGCAYVVTVRPTDGREAALDYARRIGPVAAQPSPPVAEPITVSVEEQGIRLTVTLDRDRTAFGQRVIASAEVENLGPGPVFWGHSSTCPFPVHVEVVGEDVEPLARGRTDWTGDEAILKNITIDDRPFQTDARFSFLPEPWLDGDGGMGCTTDYVTSELAEGDSLTHVVAWDTDSDYGMPPQPGDYMVEATFSFDARGERPGFDDPDDRRQLTLALPLMIIGPDVPYVAPGEALDAVLADDRYQAFLADAPRSRWMRSQLVFEDGHWVAALYLRSSSQDADPVEAIVATVDARSGEVLSVGLEDRPVPPGG